MNKDLKAYVDDALKRSREKSPGSKRENILKIASYIDHTLLKPDATKSMLDKLCLEAVENSFKTVCVNSANVEYVASKLTGSPVLPICVVGFPLGATIKEAKAFETKEAILRGAKEIDTVLNVGDLKSGLFEKVLADIEAVVEAAGNIPVKVIIETSLLSRDEKVIASALTQKAKAAFVKTSTGFAGGGATVEDIELIRRVVGENTKIKASGGVKSYPDAISMIKAGADRIGSSKSVEIVEEEKLKKEI